MTVWGIAMSNRVDFYQSVLSEPALPAGRVCVFLEEALCEFLGVRELVRGPAREYSWARLSYNTAGYPEADSIGAERIEDFVSAGMRVRIDRVYSGTYLASAVHSVPIFAGQVERIETKVGPAGEQVEVIARDFSGVFECVTVYGRWARDIGGGIVFLSGAETVFNDGGEANGSAELVKHNGNELRVFSAEGKDAKAWSCAEAIRYLLCEYLPACQLGVPSLEQLESLMEGRSVRDLDVTGLSLADAIGRCCEQVGLRYRFEPGFCESGAEQWIVFYRPGRGRVVELNLQQPGEQLSISKSNIWKLRSERNFWPVTHRYIGQGDFKVFEATFELVKAWDPGLESTDYERYSPSTNPDFEQVRDVYRKWCLNEAGDYSGQPYNLGEPYDFSKVFETSEYVHRRRRFRPVLTRDKAGRSLGYVLEITYDGGVTWWPYPFAFDNLLNECGLWLSSERLDPYVWVAAMKGKLGFRITASVVSDERVGCEVADGPVGSTAAVVDHLITLPRRFKFRKVSGKSRFAGSNDASLGVADEVDDSAALFDYLRATASVNCAVIEQASVQTPYLCLDYQVADIVTCGNESRDMLAVRRDSRSTVLIEKVRLDFAKQSTELKLVRRRMVRL